ncbi:hypothetical protein ACJX0J_011514, partial [Zea mays]
ENKIVPVANLIFIKLDILFILQQCVYLLKVRLIHNLKLMSLARLGSSSEHIFIMYKIKNINVKVWKEYIREKKEVDIEATRVCAVALCILPSGVNLWFFLHKKPSVPRQSAEDHDGSFYTGDDPGDDLDRSFYNGDDHDRSFYDRDDSDYLDGSDDGPSRKSSEDIIQSQLKRLKNFLLDLSEGVIGALSNLVFAICIEHYNNVVTFD